MKHVYSLVRATVVCGALAVLAGRVSAAEAANAAPQPVTSLGNGRIFVHSIVPLTGATVTNVDSVDWSYRDNLLLFDKRGLNQYYNIFSITAEGFRLTALTLDRAGGATELHNCTPSWHPSGRFFVFAGENRGSTDYRRSGPGSGWHCNLWIGARDGSKFWQITDLPTRYNTPRGATMPVFSPDGKKLFWTGFTGKAAAPTAFEQRDLHLADFNFDGAAPALADEQTFQPGTRRDFYESYGFSPDGNRLLFAANLEDEQPWYCMDICTLARGETEPVVLAANPGGWDRYAKYSPDGKKIAWVSSRTFNIPFLGPGGTAWNKYLRTELWIMDADGVYPKQLTFFNTPGAPESNGRRAFVGDFCWGPDGSKIAMVLHRETRNFDVESQVFMVLLGKDAPAALRAVKPAGEEGPAAAEAAPAPADAAAPAPAAKAGKGKAKDKSADGAPQAPRW
jgi:Tol biopolymer transport system component